MFVYWGANNGGKLSMWQHCVYNESPYALLNKQSIKKVTDIKTIIDGTEWSSEFTETTYGKNNSFKYEVSLQRINRMDSLTERANYGREIDPQIDPGRKVYRKPKVAKRLFNESLYTGTYKTPYSFKSIGLDQVNISLQAVNHTDAIVKRLKPFDHTHILPYRVIKNTDTLIHKIQVWDPSFHNYQYKTFFDCYDDCKELAWEFLARYYKDQRNTEHILQQNNIKIVYYDMDTYDLKSVTGLDKNITYSNGPDTFRLWNLDDPDVKNRYNKAVDICEEFLNTTGLTDTRLEFRSKDGI